MKAGMPVTVETPNAERHHHSTVRYRWTAVTREWVGASSLGVISRRKTDGLCEGCLRSLFEHGSPGSTLCDACALTQRRHPNVPLWEVRNGRSERVPAELPIKDGSWREWAACHGAPPELFELEPSGSYAPPPIAYDVADAFCEGCPVRALCGAEADFHEYDGVWGGALRYHTTGEVGYRVRDLFADAPKVVQRARRERKRQRRRMAA